MNIDGDNLLEELANARAQHTALLALYSQTQEELLATQEERDRLRQQVKSLKKAIAGLKAKLEEARRAAKRQAAPFRRKERKPEPRPPGRKPGHPAANRPEPLHVDEDVYVPLEQCPDCGSRDIKDIIDLSPQMVIDLPDPLPVLVKRYHNQSGYCAHCQHRVVSRHKEQTSTARGAAGVQVGPHALSLATDINQEVGVPYRKTIRILKRLGGFEFSEGGLVRAEQRVAERCEPTYQCVIETVRAADVVNTDDTGWYMALVQGRPWLWVFATPEPKATLYAIRLSRGMEVPLEILGEEFVGTMGIDGGTEYLGLPYDKGQCVGHLLRRCGSLLEEQKQGAARFPGAVQRVLQEGIAIKALGTELQPMDQQALCEQVQGEMRQLLEGRIKEPENRKFAEHLRRHEMELFRFLEVPLLAPTNNLAEQEIRPAVIMRKVSAGNRSLVGAYVHERLASLGRTAERNGSCLADLLPEMLKSPDLNYVIPVLPEWRERTPLLTGVPP